VEAEQLQIQEGVKVFDLTLLWKGAPHNHTPVLLLADVIMAFLCGRGKEWGLMLPPTRGKFSFFFCLLPL
jgi:hypothetical protein